MDLARQFPASREAWISSEYRAPVMLSLRVEMPSRRSIGWHLAGGCKEGTSQLGLAPTGLTDQFLAQEMPMRGATRGLRAIGLVLTRQILRIPKSAVSTMEAERRGGREAEPMLPIP
jgi:hypothetical protein